MVGIPAFPPTFLIGNCRTRRYFEVILAHPKILKYVCIMCKIDVQDSRPPIKFGDAICKSLGDSKEKYNG